MTERLLSRLEALERRLQQAEDRQAVCDCIAAYGLAADLRLDEAFVANLSADCTIDLGDAPDQVWTGHEGARRFIAAVMGEKADPPRYRMLHLTNPLTVRIAGDEATAEGYSSVLVASKGEFRIAMAGFNHWDLTRRDGRWTIDRRLRRPLGGADGPQVMMQGVAALTALEENHHEL